MQRRGGALKKGKNTEEEERQREAGMEAPRRSSITWIPALRDTPNQTTASKMEAETEETVKLEKVSVRTTAETNMWKGPKLQIKTDDEKTAVVEMKPQIEDGAHMSMEDIKIHRLQSLRLKHPSPNLSRIKFLRTNPTLGSKGGVQRSREDVRGL